MGDHSDTGIGDKDFVKLKPGNVKIVSVEQVEIEAKDGKKKYHKVVCDVKHPDQPEGTIKISGVKYLVGDKIRDSGLFINLEKKEKDSDSDKLQKNSALAVFLTLLKLNTYSELAGKDAMTVEGDSGYLCFKAY